MKRFFTTLREKLSQKIAQLLQFIRANPKRVLELLKVTIGAVVVVSALSILINYVTNVVLVRPEIVWSYPMDGDIEFPLDSPITISFSREMNKKSVEEGFSIYPSIEGKYTWEGNSFIFSPTESFSRDADIKISLDKNVRGKNNRRLKTPFMAGFKALANPKVSLKSPSGPQSARVEEIVVLFNKSIKKPEGDILEITPAVKGESKWVGSSAYMISLESLEEGQSYKVRLNQDLESLDGGILAEGYEFSFVNYVPTTLGISSEEGYGNMYDPKGPIVAYFNQPVDQQSVIEKISFVSAKDNSDIPFRTVFINRPAIKDNDSMQYSSDYSSDWADYWEQKVLIYPLNPLEDDASYKVTLDAGYFGSTGLAPATLAKTLDYKVAPTPGFINSSIRNGATAVDENVNFKWSFRSPMDSKEVNEKLVVKKNGVVTSEDYFVSTYSGTDVYFNRFLDRSVEYEFYLPSNTKDIFGRPLGEDVYVKFSTSPYRPSLYFYPGNRFATFASNVDTRFIYRALNIENVTYDLYEMSAQKLLDTLESDSKNCSNASHEQLLEAGFKHLKSQTDTLDLVSNVPTDVLFNINRDMQLDLTSGYYFLRIKSETGGKADNIAFVVGDVAITEKFTNNKTLVWTTDLDEQAVKEEYNVYIYPIYKGRGHENNILNKNAESSAAYVSGGTKLGTTNKDGVLISTDFVAELRTSYATFVEKDGDVGVVLSNWNDGIGSYEFGNVNWGYSSAEQYKGYILTDRSLYRPGQTVHFTGFARQNKYHTLEYADSFEVSVNVTSYDAGSLYSEKFSMDDSGQISGEFVVPAGASLGTYYVEFSVASSGSNKNILHSAPIEVQEYIRPEFEVVIDTPKETISRGASISLTENARYFYGAPLINAPAEYSLYKRNYIFNSSEYPEFTFFSRREYYGDDYYYWKGFEEESVLSGTGITNSDGRLTIYPSTSLDADVSTLYTFEANALGENDKKYSGTGEYVVHMANHYTGLHSKSYIGTSGEASEFDVITIDAEDNEAKDVSVNINVYLRKYFRTKTKDNSEGYYYETTYEDTLVHNDKVKTNSDGKATFSFVPKNAGTHIVEVQSFDSKGNRSVSDMFFYVSSDSSGYWRKENHNRIELVTDKDEYSSGEDAEIIPITTLEKAVGLLTIEAEDILDYKIFKQNNSGDVQKVKIDDTYRPNVYVSMMLNSPGESVFSPADFNMGITNIKVDNSGQRLKLNMSSDKSSYLPGESGKATISVLDNNGNPIRNSIVSIALVDDALMSIAKNKREDAFEHLYTNRLNVVRTAQSLTMSLDRINLNTEIGAKGGSGSKGGAGGAYIDFTRSNFAETALWIAEQETNDQGELTVSFTLPDSITRWNLFALAQSPDGSQFGQGIYKFGSEKSVFGLPALPRFMRTEDTAKMGVVVHNNSDVERTLDIEILTEGLDVLGPVSTRLKLKAGENKKVTFDIKAKDVDEASVTFSIADEDGDVKDSLKKTFPVLDYGFEHIQSFSNTLQSRAIEEFLVDPKVNKDYGGLEVRAFSSALGMADSLLSSPNYGSDNYVPFLSSWIIPNVYNRRLYLENGMEERVQYIDGVIKNLASILMSGQKGSGGWTYAIHTDYQDVDPKNTVYALEALCEVRKEGVINVDSAINRGLNYLDNYYTNTAKGLTSKDTKTLYVLELCGSDQTGYISEQYGNKAILSDSEKAELIMAMLENFGNWSSHIDQLMSELLLKADLGSNRIFWNDRTARSSGHGDFRVTATVLRAINMVDPRSPVADLAIKYLLTTKISNWSYACNSDFGIATSIIENALLRDIKLRDTDIAIKLNEEVIKEDLLSGKDIQSKVESFIPTSKLLDGLNKLELILDRGGNVFYSSVLRLLVPFDIVDPYSNELGLVRELYDTNGNLITDNKYKVGETYVVKLTVATPNTRRQMVLEDFLPAGFEAINGTLGNESSITNAQAAEKTKSEKSSKYGYGYYGYGSYIDSWELRDSSTQMYIKHLPVGIFEYTYLVRATIPGSYKYRPAHIFEQNSPDIRAHIEGTYIDISE